MSDKLIGPKVKIVLSKFLPAIFMDAMRDNASASVHMFEGEASRSLSQGTKAVARVTCPFLWKSSHNFIPAICCSKFSRFEFVHHKAGTVWPQFLMWYPVHCFYNNAVLSIRFVFICTSLFAYCLYNMRPRVHTKGACLSTLHAPAICPLVCADL